MRRCQFHHLSLIPDQAMTIAGSHIKLIDLILHLHHNSFQQNLRILCADFAGTVVNHRLIFIIFFLIRNSNDITTNRHIGIFHIHADTQSFQRRSSCIIFFWIISHNSQICSITSRFHSFRNGLCHTDFRYFCQFIHHRCICIFQRSFISQFFDRTICHSIA